MIPVQVDYSTPSTVDVGDERANLGLSANQRRPVRFHGRVTDHVFMLRLALQALGRLVWSDDTWMSREEYMSMILDPVITVHPDRIFFEAFSQDQSSYGMVIAERELFDAAGEVRCGTTNVDFTSWLSEAIGEMRSTRETWFRVDPGGFEVENIGESTHVEEKVELPEDWVRGFLQLQGAMAMPGTNFEVDPIDFLSVIRYLRVNKAKVSPRALRYEFQPGEETRVAIEPWDDVIRFEDSHHRYSESKKTRVWGRRRLRLIEGLLPYADSVEVYLKGRALPHFYAVDLPGVTFVLGLSGWTGHSWTESGSFDLLTRERPDDGATTLALEHLRDAHTMSVAELSVEMGIDKETAARTLSQLCKKGLAIYDVREREYRHRELFEEPLDDEILFPEDPRREAADALLEKGLVDVVSDEMRETAKTKVLTDEEGDTFEKEVVYEDRVVRGQVGEEETEIVISDVGRIIFGTCGCTFFQDNLLNKGPCEHMIALLDST